MKCPVWLEQIKSYVDLYINKVHLSYFLSNVTQAESIANSFHKTMNLFKFLRENITVQCN